MKHAPDNLQHMAIQALRWKAEDLSKWAELVARLKQRFPGMGDDGVEARVLSLALGVPV